MPIYPIKGLRYNLCSIIGGRSGIPITVVEELYERYQSLDMTLAIVEYLVEYGPMTLSKAEKDISKIIYQATAGRYSVGRDGRFMEYGNKPALIPWHEITVWNYEEDEGKMPPPTDFLND